MKVTGKVRTVTKTFEFEAFLASDIFFFIV